MKDLKEKDINQKPGLQAKEKSPLVSKLGWIVALLCMIGLLWTLKHNRDLKTTAVKLQVEVAEIKENNTATKIKNTSLEEILTIATSPNYKAYRLSGNQAVAPEAFAMVYINTLTKTAYIDTRGLPKVPKGKSYQVWSLLIDSLNHSSLGLMNNKTKVADNFYAFDKVPTNTAIGITLEDHKGAIKPTLNQLYALGEVFRLK